MTLSARYIGGVASCCASYAVALAESCGMFILMRCLLELDKQRAIIGR